MTSRSKRTEKAFRPAVTALLSGMLLVSTAAMAQADPSPSVPMTAAEMQAAAIPTAKCDPDGSTGADGAVADELNTTLTGTMDGYMTAYTVSCARIITQTARERGLVRRAAVIAVTTAIVESTLHNYTSATDHDSLGLFQQRGSWGSAQQRTDAAWATNAFLDKMLRLYSDGSWQSTPIGEVCQEVQVSAYPDRYQVQAGDAAKIVDAVWGYAGGGASYSGDAKADLMVLNTEGEITPRVNNGTYFAGQDVISSGWKYFLGHEGQGRLYFADWDGDGRKDLFVHQVNGDLSPRVNTGSGFSNQGVKSSGWDYFLGHEGQGRLYFADWDGDGRDDMFVHQVNGDLSVRRNTGNAFSGADVVSSGWQTYLGHGSQGRLSFADFNGDGRDDLFVQKPDGDVEVRTNTGSYFADQGVKSSGWQAYLGHEGQGHLSFADFNGDGKDDMFVHKVNGDIDVRLNNGTYFADQGTKSSGWQAYLGHEGQGVLFLA